MDWAKCKREVKFAKNVVCDKNKRFSGNHGLSPHSEGFIKIICEEPRFKKFEKLFDDYAQAISENKFERAYSKKLKIFRHVKMMAEKLIENRQKIKALKKTADLPRVETVRPQQKNVRVSTPKNRVV